MPIEIHKEQLLTLEQAARSLPGRVATSTIWRWHRKGVRGARLETVVIGGKRLTSAQALERFAAASTAASESRSTTPHHATAPGERDKSTQGRLKAAGLL
jgi:hypothetical protein